MPSISKESRSNYSTAPGSTPQVILATASLDNDIKIWQAQSGQCEKTFSHLVSQVNALEITPDKQLLAAASYQKIVMYDLNHSGPNHIISYDGLVKNVMALGFQAAGKWMYSGGEDGTAKIWDLRSRALQVSRSFRTDAPVNTVVLHPDQIHMFVGDQSGIIHIWNVNANDNESEPLIPEPGSSIQSMSIDAHGQHLSAITNKGMVYLWKMSVGSDSQLTTCTPFTQFKAHNRYGLKIKFSPCSKYLVTTSADGSAVVWSMKDLSKVAVLSVPDMRWVWGAGFTADSQYVLTASSDQFARTWSLSDQKVVREYIGHRKAITAMAFVDDVISS